LTLLLLFLLFFMADSGLLLVHWWANHIVRPVHDYASEKLVAPKAQHTRCLVGSHCLLIASLDGLGGKWETIMMWFCLFGENWWSHLPTMESESLTGMTSS
jgi:hypothetical protein